MCKTCLNRWNHSSEHHRVATTSGLDRFVETSTRLCSCSILRNTFITQCDGQKAIFEWFRGVFVWFIYCFLVCWLLKQRVILVIQWYNGFSVFKSRFLCVFEANARRHRQKSDAFSRASSVKCVCMHYSVLLQYVPSFQCYYPRSCNDLPLCEIGVENIRHVCGAAGLHVELMCWWY